MTCLSALEKTPTDRLDYDVDYSRWLSEDDTIVSANATVDNPAVTFVVDSIEVSLQVVRVWVSGGASGEESEISVMAQTQAGRNKKACFELRIREC